MNLREEFENHAAECRRMAAASQEPRTKATWAQMASRWAKAAMNQAKSDEQALQLLRARSLRWKAKQRQMDANN